MPSIWKTLSSYSNGNDNSPPLKGKSKSTDDLFKNTSSSSKDHKKKLTRARKLRHVTDGELGLNSGGAESLPASPVSGSAPRTPRHAAAGHWSKSAVPLPLPLPDQNIQQTQTDCSHAPAIARHRAPDKSAGKQIVYPTYRRRGFPQELNVDTPQNDFHLHFPTRSAPGSGSSSPILGSQRYSTVELLPPVRASPEFSSSKSPTQQVTSAFVYPHNKSLPENLNLAVRCEAGNSSSVHPLPRPPPTVRHSSDGSPIKGQWQKGRPIGRGTYGSVYIATHRETGATCALKEVEMVPGDPKFEECVKQLEQEIKLLRDMKHRNIVQYYGCEIIEDRFCIYLEYVHPGSVNKYVSEHCGAMTESIVRNFTRHILSGLAYLHSTNTIHRDIKGANLLVDAYGVVKLADFGLAKHLSGNDIELSLKGTPHWMAPELLQAMMRKDANPDLAFGVDIWSVGCTVVEMLTGKPPWGDFTWAQAMFNVLNKSPPIPESLSDEAKDFLQRCFRRQPEDRPSAVQLLQHPFVRSSHDHVAASGLVQEFPGMKLRDMESTSARISSVVRIQQGKTAHSSPRSTLEAHPRMYSRSSKSATSSPSTVDSNRGRGVSNDVYSFSCKGNMAMVMPRMGESRKQV